MQRTESSSWPTACAHATNNYRSLKELLILLLSAGCVCVCVPLQLSPVKKNELFTRASGAASNPANLRQTQIIFNAFIDGQ